MQPPIATQLMEAGREYAACEIERRVAGGMSVEEATTALGKETYALLKEVEEDTGEFSDRHAEFLRGVLLRCD